MKHKLLLVFVAVALWSCGDESKDAEGGDKDGTETHADHDHDGHDHEGHDHDHGHNHGAAWEAMEAYHTYMHDIWHPAEDGDFEPLMAHARDMADAGRALADAEIPEEYNKEGVKDMVDMMANQTEALADMVESGASEEELFEAINALHNLFHKVIDTAHPGGHDHGHDHGDHDHGHDTRNN